MSQGFRGVYDFFLATMKMCGWGIEHRNCMGYGWGSVMGLASEQSMYEPSINGYPARITWGYDAILYHAIKNHIYIIWLRIKIEFTNKLPEPDDELMDSG